MRTSIKGPINDEKWNPDFNWVDITISNGKDLYEALAETTVEILGVKNETSEHGHLLNQTILSSEKFQNDVRFDAFNEPQIKTVKEPACGIAFRRWLCNS